MRGLVRRTTSISAFSLETGTAIRSRFLRSVSPASVDRLSIGTLPPSQTKVDDVGVAAHPVLRCLTEICIQPASETDFGVASPGIVLGSVSSARCTHGYDMRSSSVHRLVLVVVAVVVHFRREICISTRVHFASPLGDSPYYWKRAAMETVISAVETCLIAYATY